MSRRPRGPVLAIGALLCAAGCGAPEAPAPSVPSGGESPPNIVLLISDDHGYPDYGFMGSRVRTPNLDRLAREGVVFTHGYSSASLCRPALATLLTGLEPLQLELQAQRARRKGSPSNARAAPTSFAASLETLPRLLAERGYTSFQAGKHWEGSFRDAGFDEGMVSAQVKTGGDRHLHQLVRGGFEPVDDFLARNADRRFFLWFAPLLPHLPHDAPASYRQPYADLKGPLARYYANVSWLDDGVGRVVDRIRELGLEERTLFVYLADNGWDPGQEAGASLQLGGPRGKLSVHDLGFRTPVILRWKGVIEPQPLRSDLVSFSDVFATLVDYAGGSLPPQRHGHSLRTLVEGGATPWPRTDLSGWVRRARPEPGTSDRETSAFFWRDARWRYVQRPGAAPGRLFDLEADPRETRDVSALHPDVVERARASIEKWAREQRPEDTAPAASGP